MFSKVVDFLISMAINGFVALVLSFFLFIPLVVLLAFAGIPVSMLGGEKIVSATFDVTLGLGFRILYAFIFLSMMAEDYGGPLKLKRQAVSWWKRLTREGDSP